MSNRYDRAKGCLYGLAFGDAMGCPVEFQSPGEFTPVTSYTGGGYHELPPGSWTDDTAMSLALADAIVKSDDPLVQLIAYKAWKANGQYTLNGYCHDCGSLTSHSLLMFDAYGKTVADHWDRCDANGCIMRIAPIAVRYLNDPLILEYAEISSKTTHSSPMCISASRFFVGVLRDFINGHKDIEEIFNRNNTPDLHENIRKVAGGSYKSGNVKGSGYVVESLEAALWAFWSTKSYRECILAAANLGNDADTTAAIAGQLAGAYYGYESIDADLKEGILAPRTLDCYYTPVLLSMLERKEQTNENS